MMDIGEKECKNKRRKGVEKHKEREKRKIEGWGERDR